MPPPKAIVCHLCNGKYFKRSYPIHLKQCEAKWKKTHSRCEYCGSAVAKHDWSDHRAHCKPTKKRKLSERSRNVPLQVPKADHQQLIPTLNNKNKIKECEECETENAIWKCMECEQSLCAMCEVDLHRKGARSRHTRIPMNAEALKQENLSVLTQSDCKQTELNPPTMQANQDPRAQCKFCSRRFNPERVEKHMRICAKAMKKKRRIYDGAKKRIEGTEFAQYQYNRSKTPEKVKEWKKNGRRWKSESAQLREIASINNDYIKQNNCDKKDDESDIVIKEISNKHLFRKHVSKSPASGISGISSKSSKKKTNFPLKGSSMKMKQRPSSNYSSKSNARTMNRRNKRETKTNISNISNNNKTRRGRYSDNKKPSIPKFDRRKSVPNNNRNHRMADKRTMKSKTVNKANENKANANKANANKSKIVERDSKIKKEKTTFKRTISEANSLPRGIDLGVNVNKIFNDKPKTMNDYVERERLRRQRGVEPNARSKSFNHKPKSKQTVPIKKKSRMQIKKEIKIDNQPIGGRTANKPSNSKDLASKRAAYFESLLQNQD